MDITVLPSSVQKKFSSESLINYGRLDQDAEVNLSIWISPGHSRDCIDRIVKMGFRALSARDKDNNLVDLQINTPQSRAARMLVRGQARSIVTMCALDCIQRIEIAGPLAPDSHGF